MSRRDRILCALANGTPDRPPLAFDAHGDSLLGVLAYYGARDKDDLYRVAGIDGFSVWDWNAVMGRYAGPERSAEDGTPLDFWGNQPQHHFALARCDTIAALRAHCWPRIEEFDFSHIYPRALEIKARDMVVSAGHIGLGYQMHNMLRGNENALADVMDEEYMTAYQERVTHFTLDYLNALLSAGRGEIEVMRADDDLGTMDRLMISPAMWRRYYKPAWRQAFDLVHKHGAKVWFHSCGYVWPLLDDLLEVGIDVWNPFPAYVKDNDHARLSAYRKGRLALDGGVSHLTLVQGTPRQVTEETTRVLDTFAPDGGLLIGPSQVLTEDMPLENIVAMFETVVRG